MVREKKYRVDSRDLQSGTQYEIDRGVKNPTAARRTARENLRRHPTYYQVLPAAVHQMELRESKMKPIRKKRQPVNRDAGMPPGFFSTPWG